MDIEGLLKSLNARSVRYVVIGAMAFPVYGYGRATLDLDLFIEPSQDNARQVRAALSEFPRHRDAKGGVDPLAVGG